MGTNVYMIKEHELYGAYMSLSWGEPQSPPQPQKRFCFCSCPQRPCVLGEGRGLLEAGLSYPWAVQEQPSFCCVSNESLAQPEPSL